jgi:hypothetical protein
MAFELWRERLAFAISFRRHPANYIKKLGVRRLVLRLCPEPGDRSKGYPDLAPMAMRAGLPFGQEHTGLACVMRKASSRLLLRARRGDSRLVAGPPVEGEEGN